MGTPTARAGVIKPGSGESQDIAVLNQGADRWDELVGSFVCTSGTRPAAFTGMKIYETDTDREYVYEGGWKQTSGPLVVQPFTANWTAMGAQTFATEVNIIGATSPAFSADNVKKYQIGIQWYNSVTTVTTDILIMRLRRTTNAAADTIVGQTLILGGGVNRGGGVMTTFDVPPVSLIGSGGTVYRATLERSSGSGTHTLETGTGTAEFWMTPVITEM
jgi:hypothetical protein